MTIPKNFTAIISLGRACDTSFQIRRIFGQETSWPFDWLITPYSALCSLIENDFQNFLKEDSLRGANDRVHDTRLGIEFLHDFKDNLSFQEELQFVQEKYFRRIERFLNLMQKSAKILFVRNHQYLNQDILREVESRTLLELLHKSYPSIESHLLVVNPFGVDFPEVQERYLSLVTIPQPEPFIWSGDNSAWDNVFDNFFLYADKE